MTMIKQTPQVERKTDKAVSNPVFHWQISNSTREAQAMSSEAVNVLSLS